MCTKCFGKCRKICWMCKKCTFIKEGKFMEIYVGGRLKRKLFCMNCVNNQEKILVIRPFGYIRKKTM